MTPPPSSPPAAGTARSSREHRRRGVSTLAIHGGREAREVDTPVVTPLMQTVNWVQQSGTDEGLRYSRYGNNPSVEQLQRRLAEIEGAEAALVLASGMGATACALLALLRPGDHLLASAWIYGGTHRLLTEELDAMGIAVTLVKPDEPRAWRKAVRKKTRAVFVETPVNPTVRVLDLSPVRYLTKEHGLALVVDSTFASPVNFRPLEHGADVVIHSATKYLNGHHDVLAGAVLGTAPFIEEVRQKMIVWGQAPDPFACWLLERGLKTLDVRVRRQNENAMRLATWLESHPRVSRVHYPGLPSHPEHALARTVLDGFGGMLAIELAGGGPAADRFVQRLRVFTHAPSLGGVDSLVSEPRYSSHAHLTPEERAAIGIPDGFVRLSVGIEDADDLIADLGHALG
ncbi:MAG TPA: aminotransferase class I/II-fold pyridoxal phosphate-dependent enzyme [Gemmatimonadaceae bacterium]|nr:aminotransferase class I/II-fold pyridoxal phosphate-dependent enzyme [Gemmatimonadaceae bacterium]